MRKIAVLLTILIVFSCGVSMAGSSTIIGGADGPTAVFVAFSTDEPVQHITMDEAKMIFDVPGDYCIIDVRRTDEFAEGHIPGAVNIPNEDIIDTPIEKLPLDNTIFVYCRSGRRSKEAAEKLAKIGYISIIEFGGIIDWKGDIEK